ncbi:MAG: 3-deoxy-manno-octulosonate cytidylyltransferase protein [Rhodocyclales bacterium]|nr:3-deoxy-manno-octulosonate cytidylyltransferase protein [Rhodocyclales bacterium]
MRVVAVIPARYGSTRLPGKPLADILGKPMIQHVYERVREVPGISDIIVATDDSRIVKVVEAFGGRALMTNPTHPSGTDRLVEIKSIVEADIYLNVQGDEPLVDPAHLTQLLEALKNDANAEVATLCHPIASVDAQNPNAVKVVMDRNGYALYFSRSVIPYAREMNSRPSYFKHVGAYAYRASILDVYGELPPSGLEAAEMLEQLRLLEAGVRIKVMHVDSAAPGVDSPACLDRVRRIMSGLPEFAAPTGSLADIKLVITDVDGVLTDGGILYDDSGECLKRFHVRDGLGIRMLMACGIDVAVISGRDSATLRKRVHDLGIAHYMYGVKDKAKACLAIMQQLDVKPAQTACLGDDSIDLPAFKVCGWPVAVADAPSYVAAAARMTLRQKGGCGAFREFSDAVLSAKGLKSVFDSAEGYSKIMNEMAQ